MKKKKTTLFQSFGEAPTIGVVGIDVGVGGVPALNQTVRTPTVTLLAIATHHHTQYRTSGTAKESTAVKCYSHTLTLQCNLSEFTMSSSFLARLVN